MFKLEFNTQDNVFNDFFNTKREIKRILNRVAYEVFLGQLTGDIKLVNGEIIGKYEFIHSCQEKR